MKTLILSMIVLTCGAAPAEPERIDFAREIRPILERSCWKCHGPEKQKSGLRLDLKAGALAAVDSGEPAITPGKAGESELIRRIETDDPEQRMPPKAEPLSPAEIKALRSWIDQGAEWADSPATPTGGAAARSAGGRKEMVVTADDRQHWSYRPLAQVAPPDVRDPAWCRTPIDRFILSALEARGMRPNGLADRRTLIRRLYFDLVGLPPSPEDVQAFLADDAPDAYESLVDRLLASRHYGERWARHWLDVARYADSDGMESDGDRPTAYHYRDFVIRAFNDDLPYQTFVRWQIAGDEYEPDNPSAVAATGFVAAAVTEPALPNMEEEKLRLRFNELDDMAVTTVSAFLGLTLGCARCHDHKYDAIPTRDYYRLQCAFTTTKRDEAFLVPRAEAAQYRERHAQWKARVQAAETALSEWLAGQKKPLTASLRNARIDALAISDEEKAALREPPDSEAGKRLAKQHEKALAISDEDYRRAFRDDQRTEWDALKAKLEAARQSGPKRPPTALALVDIQATPEPTWLLDRGDFYTKKERVQVGFLTVLTGSRPPEDYWSAARAAVDPGHSTAQRRALAEWITDLDQGAGSLLARVMVNRVWQHHFGEGLVRTVSDFGVRGEPPTHPELLEWMSARFVAEGWKLKPLHRLIVTSAAYMQDTAYDAERAASDPENRVLWRRRPQRLESEILRDAVLVASGTMNREAFGPAFKPPIPAEAMLARNSKDPYPKDAADTEATRRRTVYMFHKRVVQHPLMQVFDGPQGSVSCGRRNVTTVAPQALALLNDTFLRDRAGDLARRLLAEGGSTAEGWVTRGFALTLSRPPTDTERAASVRFLEYQIQRRSLRDQAAPAEDVRRAALADFAQALFSLNEFIYVD